MTDVLERPLPKVVTGYFTERERLFNAPGEAVFAASLCVPYRHHGGIIGYWVEGEAPKNLETPFGTTKPIQTADQREALIARLSRGDDMHRGEHRGVVDAMHHWYEVVTSAGEAMHLFDGIILQRGEFVYLLQMTDGYERRRRQAEAGCKAFGVRLAYPCEIPFAWHKLAP